MAKFYNFFLDILVLVYYAVFNDLFRMKKITPFFPAITLILAVSFCPPFCRADISSESKMLAVEYRDKGLAAQKNGDLDTALVYYQKAIELDPGFALAYNDAGVLYEAKGWTDRAKQAYGKAIDLDPTLPSPYYNLGILYEKDGDYEKAVQHLKRRVMLGAWDDVWTMKARRELKGLGVSDPEVQADFLEQHLAGLERDERVSAEPRGNDLNPRKRKRNARLHLQRGQQLYYMGMYGEALKELGIAEILDPKNKEIQKILEEVHQKALYQ